MSDIPLARERLLALAVDLDRTDPASAEIIRGDVLPLLTRRAYAKPRSAAKHVSPDRGKSAGIRAYVRANPALSTLEVARVFKVNPGRVSEALHGLR